jgi:hypothetical protein
MTPAAVLEQARAADVELSATLEGNLRWRCPRGLPDDLRSALAAHKPELLQLVPRRGTIADADTMEATGEAVFWHPPAGVSVYCKDAVGRPCNPSEAVLWTYEGAVSWFKAAVYPPPMVPRCVALTMQPATGKADVKGR